MPAKSDNTGKVQEPNAVVDTEAYLLKKKGQNNISLEQI